MSNYLTQCWNALNWTLGNKLQRNFNSKQYIFITKMHLKMSSAKWRLFRFGLNELNKQCQREVGRSVTRWALIQCKDVILQCRGSHCGDQTIVRSSYLHNGISYIGKISSLYWIRPLIPLSLAGFSSHTENALCISTQYWTVHSWLQFLALAFHISIKDSCFRNNY